MTNKLIIWIGCCIALLLAVSCGNRNDEPPKPQAYLRIDMPPHAYTLCDTSALPFTFEHSNLAQIDWKKAKHGEQWFTLNYPKYKGFVFLTYKHIGGAKELRAQVDTSYQFVEGHFSFTSGIDENKFVDRPHKLYGTTYHLKGQNVASTYQFWVTDSTSHFLRGALYIDCTPNNDSLSPVLTYIQEDMNHLIESVRWR
ncbi:MAG: hypothetical protein IKH33_05820 [Bacteroidales bacterium]|nr:hypothetical protein [Bacteroidales bacterium]